MSSLSERETRRVVAAVRQIMTQVTLTTVAAAKLSGLPQQTISRLLTKPPRRLRWSVFVRLVNLDSAFKWSLVALHPRAKRALDKWKAWISTSAEIPGTIGLLQRTYGSRGWQAVQDFRRWAIERGHHPSRVNAGIRLAVSRLMRRAETAGVEREWGELSLEEKDRYLMSAMNCERIILDRASEHDRVVQSFPVQPWSNSRVARAPRSAEKPGAYRSGMVDMDVERARQSAASRQLVVSLSPKRRLKKRD
jgi:hypothetical protein